MNQSRKKCPKCGGTGEYLHFGVCFACKGTGIAKPERQVKLKAWWANECICTNPTMQDMHCHIHTYAECEKARGR